MGFHWDYDKKVIEGSHTPEPFLNPISTSQGQNQPLYERHVTKSGWNKVKEKGRLGTAIGKKPNQLLIALAGKEQPKSTASTNKHFNCDSFLYPPWILIIILIKQSVDQ